MSVSTATASSDTGTVTQRLRVTTVLLIVAIVGVEAVWGVFLGVLGYRLLLSLFVAS